MIPVLGNMLISYRGQIIRSVDTPPVKKIKHVTILRKQI